MIARALVHRVIVGVVALLPAVAVAAPPTEPVKPPVEDGSKLPPPPDTGGLEAGDELDEQFRLWRREQEFHEHLVRAENAASRERYDEAVREYSAALRLQPGDPEALLGRAHARKHRTAADRCPTRAISDLRLLETYDPRGKWPEQRGVLMEWMAQCGSSHAADRLALAKELAAEEPGTAFRPADIRVTVARLLVEGAGDDDPLVDVGALRSAALEELERYVEECRSSKQKPSAVGLRLQADIYAENDEIEKAVAAYQALLQQHPGSEHAAGVPKLLDELEVKLELRKLDKTQGFKPSDEAQAAYNRGQQALRDDDDARATAEFQAAIQISPWFTRAHYALGVTYAKIGRFAEAVESLERVTQMERSDYQAHMTLGLIYKKEFAGAEDDRAIKHLAAALRLRPDLHRLHMLLGELYARTDRQKAREHYERFIRAAEEDDPDVDRARRALEDLERQIRQTEPRTISPPAEESLRSLPEDLQRLINEAYLRGTEYQDVEYAEKILLDALERYPTEPVVLNQLARIVYAQDRLGDARNYWERSLGLEENQVEVHEQLGLLLRRQLPGEAIPHLKRAADLGSVTARYVLAELLWEQAQPLDASAELDRYLADAGDYDLHYDRAEALREEIDRRFLQFYLVGGLVISICIAFPAVRIHRRYRGKSLRQLLERAPKSFPEVARILSLIRHEILKHNTAFLSDVGRALEVDAQDAEHRAAVLAQRMCGEQPVPTRPPRGREIHVPGIYGRFLGYIEELEKVGRAHRVTLNLQRKDPIFGPMIEAMSQLAARAAELRNIQWLRPGRKLELAKVLLRSGETLGRQAFERLSGLIRELCIVGVDPKLVQTTYEQVVGEAQFVGRPLAPLEITGLGAPVRIFRTDLEDILTNVIRNSLRSSLSYARPPVGLGIDLVTEIDEITGLGTLVVRIKDRSPEQLSNEMLRGRYVERGMGITVDLLSRYDGSIAVEPEPGWSKAVVLRFFILEDDATSIGIIAA
ncbi:MAG TPA: tetratricopeptide repeat protein [Nannocystaceae bacterium]|nr:tetratricopeptide repeat protein [Nannocystaceae bacterium]